MRSLARVRELFFLNNPLRGMEKLKTITPHSIIMTSWIILIDGRTRTLLEGGWTRMMGSGRGLTNVRLKRTPGRHGGCRVDIPAWAYVCNCLRGFYVRSSTTQEILLIQDDGVERHIIC